MSFLKKTFEIEGFQGFKNIRIIDFDFKITSNNFKIVTDLVLTF